MAIKKKIKEKKRNLNKKIKNKIKINSMKWTISIENSNNDWKCIHYKPLVIIMMLSIPGWLIG